jgi:carotenoid cleavage dioxygenase-like enzyme
MFKPMGQYIFQAKQDNHSVISIQTNDLLYFQMPAVAEETDKAPVYRTNLRVILDKRYTDEVDWQSDQSKKIIVMTKEKQYIFTEVVKITEIEAGFDYQYYLIVAFQSKEKVQIA